MGTYWKYNSKYVDGGRTPSFLLEIPGVDIKMGGGQQGGNKTISHIDIFRTNIHIHKTKHALI